MALFERDPKPRLKKGFTFPRLIGFVVVLAVLAVIAEHFATGTFPPTDCERKEIDTGARKEGICFEGNTRLIVVDRHTLLRMGTLEAKLLGVRDRKAMRGPGGSKAAEGEFVTVEVAVTNTTDAPADVGVDRDYEPRSFLARGRKIPSKGTERGTVTFAVSTDEAESVHENGNLDVVEFGNPVPIANPHALFHEPEYGVIRTYK